MRRPSLANSDIGHPPRCATITATRAGSAPNLKELAAFHDVYLAVLVELDYSAAIAVGTIAAVIVALFGNWLRGRFAPPKLELRLKCSQGVKTPVGIARESVGRWYHLRVANKRRWSPATQVQVFLLRVEELNAAGDWAITWAGEIPMRWAHQEVYPLARSIGSPADCDLCSVIKDQYIQLHPLIEPYALDAKRTEPCQLIVTLEARSLETESNRVRVKIGWNGKWSDDAEEMMRNMTVVPAD